MQIVLKFKWIKETIKQNIVKLNTDQQFLHPLQNNQFILFLSNVNYFVDPHRCIESVKTNIEKIFKVAQEKQLETVSMPIFGCGPCDVALREVSEAIFFNSLIQQMKSPNSVSKFTIVDANRKSLKQIIFTAQITFCPYIVEWPLFNGQEVENPMSKLQIKQLTKLFKNLSLSMAQIKFCCQLICYFSTPQTHEINLELKTITDLEKNETSMLQVELDQKQKQFKFFINKEPIEERRNYFLNLLIQYNYKVSRVNFKVTYFIFGPNDEYFQQIDNIQDSCTKINCRVRNWVFIENLTFKMCAEDQQLQQSIQPLLNQTNGNIISQDQRLAIILLEVGIYFQDQIIQKMKFKYFKQFKLQQRQQANLFLENQNISLRMPSKRNLNQMVKQFFKSIFEKRTNFNDAPNPIWLPEISKNDRLYQLFEINQLLPPSFYTIYIQSITNLRLQEQFQTSPHRLKSRYEFLGQKLSKEEQQRMLWAYIKKHPNTLCGLLSSGGIEPVNPKNLWGFGGYFSTQIGDNNLYYDKESNQYLALYCIVCTGKSLVLQPGQNVVLEQQDQDSGTNSDQTIFFNIIRIKN